MRRAIVFAALLSWTAPTFAQHVHEKGPNGGTMEEIAGVDAEFVTSGNKMTFHLFDKNAKPVPSEGFTGAVLVSGSGGKETLTLVAAGENSLQAEAKTPIAAGTAVTLSLKTAAGKSGQAKFKK